MRTPCGRSAQVIMTKNKPQPNTTKGRHSRTPQGDQICFGYNLGTCKQGSACPRKHVCAVPGCHKKPSANGASVTPRTTVLPHPAKKRPSHEMENKRADLSEHVKPEFGSSGYFCIELFCGSGNLTFATKHFFPTVLVWIIRLQSNGSK